MRDDFAKGTIELFAKRVGFRCSRPACRRPTSGPQVDQGKTINVGVAAHIRAASSGGPRYDPTMTSEQRSSHENGIWLCAFCERLIDRDVTRYPADVLLAWKATAEAMAAAELASGLLKPPDDNIARAERDVPALLAEMRADLGGRPLAREFTCISKAWMVNTDALVYYLEEHQDLVDKVKILENLGLVSQVFRSSKLAYFRMTESFADYLRGL